MSPRSGRLASVVAGLSVLASVTACYRAPAHTALAPLAQAATAQSTQSAAGDVMRVSREGMLTLTAGSRSTEVDVRNDSAATRAITTLISPVVPELKVERSARGSILRLNAVNSLGEHSRLFVIDGVPMADGFRLSIRTAVLESIDVIDDAGVAAPYGPRGAKGVVLISTRRDK